MVSWGYAIPILSRYEKISLNLVLLNYQKKKRKHSGKIKERGVVERKSRRVRSTPRVTALLQPWGAEPSTRWHKTSPLTMDDLQNLPSFTKHILCSLSRLCLWGKGKIPSQALSFPAAFRFFFSFFWLNVLMIKLKALP